MQNMESDKSIQMRHLHDMKYANKQNMITMQNIKHAKSTFAKPNQTY